jgi:hypothetical protein
MYHVRVAIDRRDDCLAIDYDLDIGFLFCIEANLKAIDASIFYFNGVFIFQMKEVLRQSIDDLLIPSYQIASF